MDFLPGVPLPIALILLALLDGLSVGTLLIPLLLLMAPGRVRAGRMLLYLGTIAGFYLAVGVLFLLGVVNIVELARGFFASEAGLWIRAVAGGVLIAAGLLLSARHAMRKRAAAAVPVAVGAAGSAASASAPAPEMTGRLVRWRDRLLSDDSSARVVMAVALAAGLVEIATMLPYIMGMTLLADTQIAFPLQVGALAGYCLLMIVPAIVLLVLRVVASRLVEAPLQKLSAWLQRTAAENTAAILVILGFLLARPAATELGVFTWFSGVIGRD